MVPYNQVKKHNNLTTTTNNILEKWGNQYETTNKLSESKQLFSKDF